MSLPPFDRVLFLTPDLHETGGIGAVARMALPAVQPLGVRGEVWSFWNPPAQANSAAWPHRYARGGKGRYAWWGVQAGLVPARRTLIVCLHLHLTPATRMLVARGAKLAVVLHGTEAWIPLAPSRAAGVRRADLLISVSQFTARKFQETNPGLAEKPLEVCLLGAPASRSAARASEQPPFALIVGRILAGERYKGHDELLELWPQLRQRVPTARLVVAGEGNDRARLEQKARDLGVADAVKFVGRVDDATLQGLYRDCSFFVMPSSGEGFGVVFLEAMRAGKACVGGPGAPAEVIVDGVTGRVVERGELAAAVTELFENPGQCAQWGQAGRERFERNFTMEHFQQRLLLALEKLGS